MHAGGGHFPGMRLLFVVLPLLVAHIVGPPVDVSGVSRDWK